MQRLDGILLAFEIPVHTATAKLLPEPMYRFYSTPCDSSAKITLKNQEISLSSMTRAMQETGQCRLMEALNRTCWLSMEYNSVEGIRLGAFLMYSWIIMNAYDESLYCGRQMMTDVVPIWRQGCLGFHQAPQLHLQRMLSVNAIRCPRLDIDIWIERNKLNRKLSIGETSEAGRCKLSNRSTQMPGSSLLWLAHPSSKCSGLEPKTIPPWKHLVFPLGLICEPERLWIN